MIGCRVLFYSTSQGYDSILSTSVFTNVSYQKVLFPTFISQQKGHRLDHEPTKEH